MQGFDAIKIKTTRREGNRVTLTIGGEILGGSIRDLGEFVRRMKHLHRKTMGAAPPAEFSEHALFTETERQSLREVAKYRPPDPTKFTLLMSARSGKMVKDRQYKTFKAAETALRKAIKRDLMTSKNDLYRVQLWSPEKPGPQTRVASYSTDYRPTSSSVWYKRDEHGHKTMFKVYS